MESIAIERDIMDTAKEEGRQEGQEEKGIEIAKELLGLLDDNVIAEKAGLSIEKVQSLRS